ncbi:type IA DNA topoisomerase [Apilactobacillus micheneri]|uniref:DNA topoisomerase n=1 Tax=Apilactobacillus micheneri TaxID=1899430 RepID=UPI00112ACD97|nr:DNA topoisomerase [Apilactobacillus micheneri]TPR49209.1 type IA DNA topoisomerase [Apilactobacillus micheneri]
MLLILAEKHDQLEQYANALKGNGEIVTESKYITDVNNSTILPDYPNIKIGCLQGHLYQLKEPAEYDAKWEDWDTQTLPIFPKKMTFKLPKYFKGRQQQLKEVIDKCDDIWLATDSDVEGESLGYIFLKENNGLGKLSGRVWLDGLTKDSLVKAFNNVKDPSISKGKAEAGYCRMIGDWLIGMNYSRLATVLLKQKGFQDMKAFPIGRVQTPTVKLIADRRRERANFKPNLSYRLKFVDENGLTFLSDKEHSFDNEDDAKALMNELNNEPLHITNVETKDEKTTAPKLNKLGDMQGMMNEYYGLSTSEVGDDVLESLYNKYHLTSYPRTDSDLITTDDFNELLGHLNEYARFYNQVTNTEINSLLTNTKARNKYIDKTGEKISKAGAHHALTTNLPLTDNNQIYLEKYGQKPITPFSKLSDKMKIVYFHVLASTLAMFAADYHYQKTNITAEKGDITFTASINIPQSEHSFKDILSMRAKVENHKLVAAPIEQEQSKQEHSIDPSIYQNDQDITGQYQVKTDKTKAPQPITESNMLRVIMPKYNLGTQSTRDKIIPELIKTGMIEVNKKADKKHNLNKHEFVPTEKALIELDFLNQAKLLDFSQISSWEDNMNEISLNNDSHRRGREFMHSIHQVIDDDIEQLIQGMQDNTIQFDADPTQHHVEKAQNKTETELDVICPKCSKNQLILFEFDKKGKHHKLYLDKDKKCKFHIPANIGGLDIKADEVQQIYDHDYPVHEFIGNDGNPFDASLYFDNKKGLLMEFPREFEESYDIDCPKCKKAKIGLQVFNSKGKEHECYSCHNLKCNFRIYKNISGLDITPDILQEIIDNKPITRSLTSKDGNQFKAILFYDKGKVQRYFPKNVVKNYDINCPKCNKGNLQLTKSEAKGYTFYKYTCENCDLLFDQTKFGKTFTPEEVVEVITSGKTGKVLDAVSQKTGGSYQIKVKYQPTAMPRNRVKVNFANE